MDQNPYAGGGYDAEIYAEPERTSLAAVFGLICSLICCLPVVPVLGVVLGAFGLIGIGRSNGRVGGRGLAIAAIVLGLLFTFAQIGAAIGLRQIMSVFINQIGSTASQALTDAEAGNYDGVRGVLAGDLSGVSDESIAAWRAAYGAKTGDLVSTPQTVGELFSGYMNVGPLMQQFQGRNDLIPLPATFANDSGLIIMVIDQTGQTTPAPGTEVPMLDIIVVASDGTAIRLSDYAAAPPAPEAGGQTPPDEPAGAQMPDEVPEDEPAGEGSP